MNPRTVVKKIVPKKAFRTIEPYGHFGEAVALNIKNKFPARGLKVIGVTGTNGKTTTSFLIHKMLTEAGFKAGLMTTVAYGVGDDIKPQIEHMTTASVPVLHKRFKMMKDAGVEWLVLETTSHALAQHRVFGVPYGLAVMTNITEEHLDYHDTFERYRDAKRRLFKLANKNRKGLRVGVINADDPSAELFKSDIKNPIMYGLKKGDLRASDVKMTASGSTFKVKIGSDEYNITCHLPGSFNVYNSLAALGVGRALGLTKEQIEQGIAALTSVEGRMVSVDEGQDFGVIVDYAHTPDSFERIFKDIRKTMASRASHLGAVPGSQEERVSRTSGTVNERQTPTDAAMHQEPAGAAGSVGRQGKAVRGSGRLIVMFGSAGRRDEKKRAVQGNLAGKYADLVFITEEDDRDMDGLAIMDEIATGAEAAGKIRNKDLFLIHKREDAIKAAFKVAKKGDVVLLLGKGHEKSILTNGPKAAELRHLQQDDANPERVIERPYNEIEAAKATLAKLKS